MNAGKRFGIFLFVLIASIFLAYLRASEDGVVATEIRSLLPQQADTSMVDAATQRLKSNFELRHFFLLEGGETLEDAAQFLQEKLKSSGYYSDVFDDAEGRVLKDLQTLFAFRYKLLSLEQSRRLKTQEGREAFLESSRQFLFTPFSGVTAELLQNDPFLVSLQLLSERSLTSASAFQMQGGFLQAEKEGRSFVFVPTKLVTSPFSASFQKELGAFLTGLDAEMQVAFPNVVLARTGVVEHAYRAAQQARTEVSIIGSLSAFAILALVLFIFRSIKPLFGIIITILAGIVVGASASIIWDRSINLITFVAGTSLIGISVDYAFHYFCELYFGQSKGSVRKSLAHIRPGVFMGFATTVVAFGFMAFASFPGLRQLALFSLFGVSGAFLTLWCVFPLMSGDIQTQKTRFKQPLFLAYWSSWTFKVDRKFTVLGLGFVFLIAVVALPRLSPVDDVRAFQSLDTEVEAMEAQLSQFSQAQFSAQYFLIEGRGEQEVVEREIEFQKQLIAAQESGALGEFIAITQLIPSVQAQNASLDAMALMEPQLNGWIEELGLDPSVGHSFRREMQDIKPLTVAHLNEVDAFSDLAALWIEGDGQSSASMIALKGPLDTQALSKIASETDYVTFVDPLKNIETVMSSYRRLVEGLIGAAYLIIFIFLVVRYQFRAALKIIAPPVLAGLAALIMLGLLGQPYTVFATVGLVLIMGIGIDYTLFLRECEGNPNATALAISMSALSTVLAFGLLAFSATPAIQNFGLTIFYGISIAFLLAPVARVREDV